ncbi:MAG: hypothetical protein HPZ79_04640 [Oscillospiraceae bacterium]|nr:hypothetical protein [Oscillospiraceae bacterium]
MKRRLTKAETVGPDWGSIFAGFLIIPIIIFFHMGLLEVIMLSFVASIVLFSGLRYFGINANGISQYCLGIRYRFTAWDQIDQISSYHYKDIVLVVSLKGCKRFSEAKLTDVYLLSHPIKVFTIYNHVKKALPLINQYYGPLDYER